MRRPRSHGGGRSGNVGRAMDELPEIRLGTERPIERDVIRKGKFKEKKYTRWSIKKRKKDRKKDRKKERKEERKKERKKERKRGRKKERKKGRKKSKEEREVIMEE